MKRDYLNPYPWYAKMRAEQPVFYDPNFVSVHGLRGAWQVFRYDDVKQVLSDYKNFTVEFLEKNEDNSLSYALNATDPPTHRRLRGLVSQVFTPKAIASLKPWIEHAVDRLLDDLAEHYEAADIVEELAIPLPIQVIAHILGIPFEDRDLFKSWSVAIALNPAEESEAELGNFVRVQQEMDQYFSDLIKAKRENPADDLISQLLAVEVDGQKLEMPEILGFCHLLLLAGNETTTNFISIMLYVLAQDPALQTHLYQNPQDMSKALEEVLRYRAPVQSMLRMAVQDVQLSDQLIKKGDYLNAWIGSANHDPQHFPNPEKVDIDRPNLKHVSFGHGVHFCMGAPLARLETQIVISKFLQRFRDVRLPADAVVGMHPSEIVYSIKSLPVRFVPRHQRVECQMNRAGGGCPIDHF